MAIAKAEQNHYPTSIRMIDAEITQYIFSTKLGSHPRDSVRFSAHRLITLQCCYVYCSSLDVCQGALSPLLGTNSMCCVQK